MIRLKDLLSILSNIDRAVIYNKSTNQTIYVHFEDDEYFKLLSYESKVENLKFTTDYGDKCVYIVIYED